MHPHIKSSCPISRREALLWTLALTGSGALTRASHPAFAQTQGDAPIFRFETEGFWLNLHHFLYVLGRAEANTRDSTRAAVVRAPGDQERGLEGATDAERSAWQAAVTAYAETVSQLDTVFDDELSAATGALASLTEGDVAPDAGPEALRAAAGDVVVSEWAEALGAAAPLYSRVWWPEHRAANRRFESEALPLLAQHGAQVQRFVEEAYGERWTEGGYPVQLSGYCNWAGAYSTTGQLLVVSSLDTRLRGTLVGLEITFHEAMHQWDGSFFDEMVDAARAEGVRFPRGLSHAILFFTAGEAVRAAVADHVPYAERFGIWERGSGRFLPAIRKGWEPYLLGSERGDTDARRAGLRALMKELPELPAR